MGPRRLAVLRVVVGVAVLVALLLPGCAVPVETRAASPAQLDYAPGEFDVTSVVVDEYSVRAGDGIDLAVRAYVPVSEVDGSAVEAEWGLVLFMHGWGGNKEGYEGGDKAPATPAGSAPASPTQGRNYLQEFARAGLIAVAYDARGFGASGGAATVAGPLEQSDFRAVLAAAQARHPTNGLAGIIGQSYGAGQAIFHWARNADVVTAVPMYGWVDLADGLAPGKVPKLEWAQTLYAYGAQGGTYDPLVHNWYQAASRRGAGGDAEFALALEQMKARSAGADVAGTRKPILACQGMQESLFPQIERIADSTASFRRAYVYTGGHGSDDPGCWSRALEWMRFFLGGFDTRVDRWPVLETVSADGEDTWTFATWPAISTSQAHLRFNRLDPGPASNATFRVEQRFVGGAGGQPSAVWDQSGQPNPAAPGQARTDPTTVVFDGPAVDVLRTVVGTPRVRLHVVAAPAQWQVAVALVSVAPDGSAVTLSQGAAAVLSPDDLDDGWLEVPMTWFLSDLVSGQRLQLRVGANDPSVWYPLMANYDVTFDGQSYLEIPTLK